MKVINKSLHEQIYDLLKDKIITGEDGFLPGDRCNISEVAEEFNVSATPVKEAFKKLESDGLVDMKPRSGTYISKLNKDKFKKIVVVRKGLEKMIIDILNEKDSIDNQNELLELLDKWEKYVYEKNLSKASKTHLEFHRALIGISNNEVLIDLYDHLLNRSSLYMAYHSNEYIIDLDELNLHRNILEKLMNLEKDQYIELVNLHFDNAQERILSKI
ncbi:GntR family transcriptional regulator [Halanaerobium congolense]|jgi:DNA-binding GntR family transcriptional regulator|uniref:DNA-binding GntR family transcriptional regulator n=1 Tax=Halanaerobium congolense TaxID=54121 RepID=A0A4R7DZ13_9FIRM|nr:GntR family transcriptional regulator [Halanaerobium congolense]TDS25882.1 DNA-binding GntR family transcriptional regulator [Halanaerobium congolense]